MPLDRRQMLVGIAAAMGCALSSGAVRALDAALDFTPDGQFKALNGDQVSLLRAVMDTILPETETASASGAGVDYYIDHMLAAVLAPDEGRAITGFLATFGIRHPGFAAMDTAARQTHLGAVDADLGAEDEFHGQYRALKELILTGYYTSEIGATEELAYDPVPGPFHNGPVSDFDRTWST